MKDEGLRDMIESECQAENGHVTMRLDKEFYPRAIHQHCIFQFDRSLSLIESIQDIRHDAIFRIPSE